MMQAIKCSTPSGIPYYQITTHNSGTYTSPNTISITAPTHNGSFKFKRTTSNGTLRDISDLPYSPPSSYLTDDKGYISVPLNKVTELKARFNRVKSLAFNFSYQMPNIKLIWLRGNLMNLGNLDLSYCTSLETLDISDNYIDSIDMPIEPPLAVFKFAYFGGLSMSGMPPKLVMSRLTIYAYVNGIQNGTLLTDACSHLADGYSPSLALSGLEIHQNLVNVKGWSVGHLSWNRGNLNFTATSIGGNQTLSIMSSTYNWEIIGKPDWVGLSITSSSKSNIIKEVTVSVLQNTTGQSRSATLEIRKLKDDGNEYKGRGSVIITQTA